MRDKLKSFTSIDESDYDISTHNSQGTDTVGKSVSFAYTENDDKSYLSQMVSSLSQENASYVDTLLTMFFHLMFSVQSLMSLIGSYHKSLFCETNF